MLAQKKKKKKKNLELAGTFILSNVATKCCYYVVILQRMLY